MKDSNRKKPFMLIKSQFDTIASKSRQHLAGNSCTKRWRDLQDYSKRLFKVFETIADLDFESIHLYSKTMAFTWR